MSATLVDPLLINQKVRHCWPLYTTVHSCEFDFEIKASQLHSFFSQIRFILGISTKSSTFENYVKKMSCQFRRASDHSCAFDPEIKASQLCISLPDWLNFQMISRFPINFDSTKSVQIPLYSLFLISKALFIGRSIESNQSFVVQNVWLYLVDDGT